MAIILLGILSAITIPRIFSTSTFSNANTLNELQSALNYARNRAVTAQCTIEFRISSTGWSVFRDADCVSDATTASCPADPLDFSVALNDAGANTALAGSAAASSGLQRVFFTPQGRLYRMTSGSGCTTLPGNVVVPGVVVNLTPTATLRLDGPTGYAAVQ